MSKNISKKKRNSRRKINSRRKRKGGRKKTRRRRRNKRRRRRRKTRKQKGRGWCSKKCVMNKDCEPGKKCTYEPTLTIACPLGLGLGRCVDK